ncbi:MAG: hypothetical protein AAFV53_27290 [Myxococcota bacterium]
MSRRVIVPIDFGGSPTPCWLRPPLHDRPTPALVQAMVQHYQTERARPGQPLEIAFFRGGVPDDSLLSAAQGHAIRVNCSPADLSRADAARLWAAGVQTIELHVCTFRNATLSDCHRGYRGDLVAVMLRDLKRMGFTLGVTLVPGLPSSAHQDAVEDARTLTQGEDGAPMVSFVRIIPALALAKTVLAELVETKRWRPMHLGEAVTTTLAMVEVLEAAGIAIARVGLQPGQDTPHRVVAGPYHPNLRHLVEVRRFYGRMASVLRLVPAGSRVEVEVNPRDLSWAKGTANENIRALRARLSLQELTIRPSDRLSRGEVKLGKVG